MSSQEQKNKRNPELELRTRTLSPTPVRGCCSPINDPSRPSESSVVIPINDPSRPSEFRVVHPSWCVGAICGRLMAAAGRSASALRGARRKALTRTIFLWTRLSVANSESEHDRKFGGGTRQGACQRDVPCAKKPKALRLRLVSSMSRLSRWGSQGSSLFWPGARSMFMFWNLIETFYSPSRPRYTEHHTIWVGGCGGCSR